MSTSLLKSKAAALCALIIVIALLVLTFKHRCAWWAFVDIFFAFMMTFTHLAALFLARFNTYAAKTLDKVALWCAVLTVVSLCFIATAMLTSCNGNKPEEKSTTAPVQTASPETPDLGVEAGQPVCIDFYAEWCPPCRQMKPIFHEMEQRYEGQIKFMQVNTDEQPELAQSFGIEAIPTFVFLNADLQEVGRITGACTPADMQSALDTLLP